MLLLWLLRGDFTIRRDCCLYREGQYQAERHHKDCETARPGYYSHFIGHHKCRLLTPRARFIHSQFWEQIKIKLVHAAWCARLMASGSLVSAAVYQGLGSTMLQNQSCSC